MDYEVVISEQAEDDLANIYSAIRDVLKSEINADAVLGRLYSALEELKIMAGSHHLYPNEPWPSLGIHYFSLKNYSVFYVVKDSVATVIHVAYGKRDLDKVLAN